MTFLAHGGGWEWEGGGVLPTWPHHPLSLQGLGVSVILSIELLTGHSLRRTEDEKGPCTSAQPGFLPICHVPT